MALAWVRYCAVHRNPSVIWVSSPRQSHRCHENGAPIFEKRKEHKEERKHRKTRRKEKRRNKNKNMKTKGNPKGIPSPRKTGRGLG